MDESEIKIEMVKKLAITNYIMTLIQTGRESFPKIKLLKDYQEIGDEYYSLSNTLKNIRDIKN